MNYIKWDIDPVVCAFSWDVAVNIIFSNGKEQQYSHSLKCIWLETFYQTKKDKIWGILFKAMSKKMVVNVIKPEQVYITSQKTSQSSTAHRSQMRGNCQNHTN